jgi:predicted  nucleic acid-binding Zn-ribbon protein
MSVRQLYQLQCLDLEIESAEQSSARAQVKLGEDEELRQAKAIVAKSQSELDGLLQQQKENDWAISDITAKMTVANESLYSGRVRNPKELTSLQQELEGFKHQRDPLEEKAMNFMEKIENVQAHLKKLDAELKTVEGRLREERKTLHAQLGELAVKLAALKEQHSQALASIPPDEAHFYADLKKRRGVAVARVEQGTCGSCRISLSSTELQRARSGKIVQCSSCSRILLSE